MASVVNDELQKIIVRFSACLLRLTLVNADMAFLQPGAEYAIVGGYRRGKPLCGDVDIVFTHPEPNKEKGALEELLKRLEKAKLGKQTKQCRSSLCRLTIPTHCSDGCSVSRSDRLTAGSYHEAFSRVSSHILEGYSSYQLIRRPAARTWIR